MQVSQLAKEIAERILRQKDDELTCRVAAELVQSAMDAARDDAENLPKIIDYQISGKTMFSMHYNGRISGVIIDSLNRRIAEAEQECERLRALLGNII